MIIKKILSSLILLLGITAGAQAEFTVGDTFADDLRSGGTGPQMVVIPGGRFVPGGWPLSKDTSGEVKIDYRMAFGLTEVTLGQYRRFLKATRSGDLRKLPKGGDDLPVTGVSWDDAEAYVSWLSRETGHYYRLPSASEWEHATRAGSMTIYSWGDEVGDNQANCINCGTEFDGELAPVGSFAPNPWGLYDMHGNVWEWTKDCLDANSAPPFDGSPQLFGNCDLRELRGGSAQSDSWAVRASTRASALRQVQDGDVGFRVVMDIPVSFGQE